MSKNALLHDLTPKTGLDIAASNGQYHYVEQLLKKGYVRNKHTLIHVDEALKIRGAENTNFTPGMFAYDLDVAIALGNKVKDLEKTRALITKTPIFIRIRPCGESAGLYH